jgi:hypothetical protein
MKQCLTLLTILVGSSLTPMLDELTAAEPIEIGARLELFVDDYLIDRFVGKAELRLNRLTERQGDFTCDKPWEGNHSGSATFIQDGDTYRMYCKGANWQALGKATHDDFTCYAESKNGIHWTRPELGIVEFDGSKKNNIILSGEAANTFVPFRDSNPHCKPEEQYKALVVFSNPVRGLYAFASPDGVHWRRMGREPLITKGKFDSQNLAFWDSVRGRYVAHFREMSGPNDEFGLKGPQLGLDDNGPARDVLTSTSPDFLHWTEPQWLKYPDSPRMQIYLNQIRPYYRAPHLFVGFPGRFMAGREIEKDLPITKHPSYKFGSITETLFMTSRDGLHFRRWGEAYVRPGPRKERWIYAGTFPTYGLLVTKSNLAGAPDELSLYVNDGGNWSQRGKATRFRRYTMRIDGFVSVNAPLSGGELVTKPLTFTGSKLAMNFATSAAGTVQIEIQNELGNPIEGLALDDCPEIFGDEIDRVVAFKRGSDLSHLAGKPICLRFVLKDADLYSFQFRP